MSASDVLWEREEHTEAKHRLVVGYLHAWFPIMADRNRALNIIDGFAGPGRYIGGQPGSPLLMLQAFTDHRNRTAKMDAATISYDFIEVRADRADHLRREIEKLSLPANVQVAVHTGEFDEVMGRILDEMPPAYGLAPTFGRSRELRTLTANGVYLVTTAVRACVPARDRMAGAANVENDVVIVVNQTRYPACRVSWERRCRLLPVFQDAALTR